MANVYQEYATTLDYRGAVLGSTGIPACAASCYVLRVAMRGNDGCVGLTSVGARPREPMRDLRHAVPGDGTWRDCAIRRDVQI
jgi:hypothetical protein